MAKEKDLKAQNRKSLYSIYVGTFVIVAIGHLDIDAVSEMTTQVVKQVSLTAIIATFGAVLSDFLPNSVKHPLVYLRLRNVLPGHRCRRICERDSRLYLKDLEIQWPDLFILDMEETAQNAFWYKNIYLPVRNAPAVIQAHRSFLLYRDAASGLFILLLGLLLWRGIAVYISLPSLGGWSLGLLVIVILVLCQAGRQSGNRMVANAVAVNQEN